MRGVLGLASRRLHPASHLPLGSRYLGKRMACQAMAASASTWAPASGLRYAAPQVVPSINEHRSSFIMIHGLGDTSDGWADIGGMLGPDLPNTKFVFPNAPIRPITLNGGMRMTGWYDIASLDRINAEQDVAAIKESQQYIEHLVQQEVAAGIPPERVVVGGFSQGGAVALTMLRSPLRLAGIMGLSAYLLLHDEKPLVSEANAATPVLMCHGDADQVVAYEYGKESAEWLKEAGVQLDFKTYKWMGHEARADELADVREFLQARLNQKWQ